MALASPAAVREIINKYGFRFKKALGQNFLIDHNIVANIVKAAEVTKDDFVVEIGPGIGSLTEELSQAAEGVLAVELDRQLIAVLAENLKDSPNVTVVNSDVLKIDLDAAVAAVNPMWGNNGKPYKVVANLPYYITTPVIMHLLEKGYNISQIVIMIQKEVAERLVAKPGGKDYGAITLAVGYYTEPEIVMKVPNTVFMPRPEVDSAVVRLRLRSEPPVRVGDKQLLFKTIKAAFGQRRKTLLNSLKGGLGFEKAILEEALLEAGLEPGRRGETLGIEEFAALTNNIAKRINN